MSDVACMGAKNDRVLFGDRCGAPVTHETLLGPRCARCAAGLRAALRDPACLGNVLAGAGGEPRARTEEEIAKLVRPLLGVS